MSWFSKKGRQEESAAPTRKELRAAFMSYFDVTGDPASERNFIEQHPLLLHPKSTSVLSLLSAQLHAEWQTRPERLRAMGQAALGRWEEAQQSYHLAYEIEDALVEQSAGLVGLEAVLKEVPNIALYEGYCLARLTRYEEAISTIEQGRMRDLKATLALETTDADCIKDAQLKQAYEQAREEFIQLRQAINSQTSSANYFDASPALIPETLRDTIHNLRNDFLAVTRRYHEAKANLDQVVARICASGNPADFLRTDLDTRRVLDAVRKQGAGYALVYLMATPWGGMALASLGSHQEAPGQGDFVAFELPALTENTVHRDLQSWRAQVPIPTEEELRASGLVDGDSSFPSEHRGLRYSQGFAEMLIRSKSRASDPDAYPFADPIYWAGFQIIGW